MNPTNTPSLLQDALFLASKGLKVFPITPGAKKAPLILNFKNASSSDENQIKEWWAANPKANIGVSAEGLCVIDVDSKKGGLVSLRKREEDLGSLPATFRVFTPSGGFHLYFTLPPETSLPNSVEKLGPGLDTRVAGGYVVGPGSVIGENTYKAESKDFSMAELGAPWIHALGKAKPRGIEKHFPELSDTKLKELRKYLELEAEPAIEGAGGRKKLFAIAAHATEVFRAPAATLLELMWGFYNPRCVPPWNESDPYHFRDFEEAVYNANRKCENVMQTAKEVFDVVTDGVTEPPKLSTRRFKSFNEIRPDFNRRDLIEDIWTEKSHSMIYGDSNVGKTFLILSRAFAIARGAPWFGKKTVQGSVLYLSLEGEEGIGKRVEAYRRKENLSENLPFFMTQDGPDFGDPNSVKAFVSELGIIPNLKLILIDTLSIALGASGFNENAAEDVSKYNAAVQFIINQTGAHVCQIHHSGKDQSKKERGSTAIRGKIDTIESVYTAEKHSWFKAGKQRDKELLPTTPFWLVPTVIHVRDDGKEISSCVVSETPPAGFNEFKTPELNGTESVAEAVVVVPEKKSKLEISALDTAQEALSPDLPSVGLEVWLSLLQARYPDQLEEQFYKIKAKAIEHIKSHGYGVRRGKLYPPKR